MGWKLEAMDVSMSDFTPRAVARCSGLSQSLQRVWRKRGHLPESPEWEAKFSVVEAASISVRQQLSQLGVPPSQSIGIGERSGRTALYFALLNASGSCEVYGAEPDVEGFLRAFDDSDEIATHISGAEAKSRFLWRGESGVFLFESDLQNTLDRERTVAASIIDLMVLGTRFGDLAEKPLFSVYLHQQVGAGNVRRVTNPTSFGSER